MMASTLVETVSISYEDFSESFLTCSTCLCTYDGQERTPKLLPCSHTICYSCLERIVNGNGVREVGSFRCPICREMTPLPRGGVSALPPSFLVNQLLDLMASQRREVIPKCSIHITQELLFCESCDCVFCTVCAGAIHGSEDRSCEHTVIPFSVAVKRLSEILLYKANLCIKKLDDATESVGKEISKLDKNADHAYDAINNSFHDLIVLVNRRRQELLEKFKSTRDIKKKVLQHQLEQISEEKEKIKTVCQEIEYQIEMEGIVDKINHLGNMYECVNKFQEPKENSYLHYKYNENRALCDIQKALSSFGKVNTSTTFPSLCTAVVQNSSIYLQNVSYITTVDYYGVFQAAGGDPVSIEVKHEDGSKLNMQVVDCNNGTYKAKCRPAKPGIYQLFVVIFGRAIKGSPFSFNVSEHIDPINSFGCHGNGDHNFLHPVSVANHPSGSVFVLDTGNNRIKILSSHFEYLRNIQIPGLHDSGCTGLALTKSNTLLVVNWKTKYITEIGLDGSTKFSFSHPKFIEPVDIAVNVKKEILVADNSACCIFVLDSVGHLIRTINVKESETAADAINCITSVSVGPEDNIYVAGSSIKEFTSSGTFLKTVYCKDKMRGHFGGIAWDGKEYLLATRSDKNGSCIQVFHCPSNDLLFSINSFHDKLKRPSGICVTSDYHVIVTDLGNNCIKKYRYF